MPYKALRNNPSKTPVNASDVTISEKNDTFLCSTPGCRATMHIVNVGDVEEAFFRRNSSSPFHISSSCVRCGITFDPTKYDESKFEKDKAFDWLFSEPTATHKGTTGTKRIKVGCKSMGFRSLGSIYEMCVSKGKSATYNGVLIDDLLADYENFTRYKDNIEGKLLVECSYFRKAYKEYSLLFNYPNLIVGHNLIKVKFQNEELFWTYYNKLKGCHHTEPIVIAGDWIKIEGNPEYQAECTIFSSRQIYIVK